MTIRFLVSPTELLGEDGKVTGIKLVRNELVASDDGSIRPKATDRQETIPVGLVFRSVGYKGNPLPDVPYHESWGTILNEAGRVVNKDGSPVTGLYTAGWIKRGPTGVIGTNKTDAKETVGCMVEDLAAGAFNAAQDPTIEGVAALVASRSANIISYDDWLKIDAAEVSRGEAQGRPRVKFTSIDEMLAVTKA